MRKHGLISLTLIISTQLFLLGCEPPPKPVSGSPVLDAQLGASMTQSLEQSRKTLAEEYKRESQDKSWYSAKNIAVTMLGCLQRQNELKKRGVQFNPVTTKAEALGWAQMALDRTSQAPRNSVPGTHDPVAARNEVEKLINALRTVPD